MKTAILSILVLFAFISLSTFGLPTSESDLDKCLDDCLSGFDFCEQLCDEGVFDCDACDNKLVSDIDTCVKRKLRK